jgi:Fe-coproporphyrin III synthase
MLARIALGILQNRTATAEAVVGASHPAVVHVTTNGSRPEAIARFAAGFSAPRRLRFLVSLDGLPEEHDRSRGPDAGFEHALETVHRLAELRRLGIGVSVNHTVVSAQSLADGEPLRRLFEPIGIDVQSVVAYAYSSTYGLKLRGSKATHLILPRGYPLHPALQDADVIDFVEGELARAGRLRDPLVRVGKRYYLRGLLSRLEGDAPPRPHPRCVALRSHLRILPDGSVPVCQFNGETVGNVAAQPFEEVWEAERARDGRAWVDGCPGCWAECEVIPNALYTGDFLRKA